MTSLRNAPILVVGAGIMGAGIAQVAAQASHPVFLFDMCEGAAALAKSKLAATLGGLVTKGKISSEAAADTLARIEPIHSLEAAASAELVVEAIIENLEAKRSLFKHLESVVGETAILASNTSSISVTAIANGLRRPDRLVGMHFFNPVPQMKLVEVVSGLQTDPTVAQAIDALSVAWGKVPVHARSTPGFIVNRIARPYYAESLALLHEQAATPQQLDACLKAAGFRMGPCELMDLIGHDTNFAVTNSVFEANFGDKRYVPSLVQRELVDGGLLGRKSGRGFYTYPEGPPTLATTANGATPDGATIIVHGSGEVADSLEQMVIQGGLSGRAVPTRQHQSTWVGLAIGSARLVLTDGHTAGEIAAREGLPDVAVFDRPLLWPAASGGALAYAVAPQARAGWREQIPAWLSALGFLPVPMADTPGLVVARTIAMLINEAADAVLQSVCTPEGADAAMRLGVNYPAGPFEWLPRWGVAGVVQVLSSLDEHYRGERYRISPWLRRQLSIHAQPCPTPSIH